ncbi:MAG: DUF2301 domain-containing membrane protein [Synechococcales cyanobacterium T60_A2020_003]|nr:DUF2301 domain-containing membrane protein [Synechococcales cyanobacterium T60_A2020_003]
MASSASSPSDLSPDAPVYQGQFGEFAITRSDRQGVILYRTGLAIAAVSFAIATGIVLGISPLSTGWLTGITVLYGLFSLGLGLSLWTIHIYLRPLHRALQAFWGIGTISALVLAIAAPEPLAAAVFYHPALLWGMGFTFAALTGIFFKEAFCFDRLETKLLTPLVPLLLLGHMTSILTTPWEKAGLAVWAILLLVFAARKCIQPIPPDIGDKSVFEYLERQRTEIRTEA